MKKKISRERKKQNDLFKQKKQISKEISNLKKNAEYLSSNHHDLDSLPLQNNKDFFLFEQGEKELLLPSLEKRTKILKQKDSKVNELKKIEEQIFESKIDLLLLKIKKVETELI